MTIEELANLKSKEILLYEDLKECVFTRENKVIPDRELYPLIKKKFENPKISFLGGESNIECQRRSVNVLKELLNRFKGHSIVIGTHGLVMTLMMNYFDSQYNYEFLMNLSKPDIYKLEFNNEKLIDVRRIWKY